MDNRTYREIGSIAKLRHLIENHQKYHLGKSYVNGELIDGEAQLTIMKKYLSALEHGKGQLGMNYRQHDGVGRRWSTSSGLAQMSRIVRHTITKGILRDIDCKNAHPVLLEHYCKTKNIPCMMLSEYNENRDMWLQRICADREWERDDAKKFLLAPINKEKNSIDWLAWENKQLKKDLHSYMMEMNEISRRVSELNPDLYKQAAKKKDYNIGGSCVNRLLCDMENRMLQCLIDVVDENGGEVNALVYDGLMASGIKDMDELCMKMERRVKETMGVSVQIVEKIMDEGVELDSLDEPVFEADPVVDLSELTEEASKIVQNEKKKNEVLKTEMAEVILQKKNEEKTQKQQERERLAKEEEEIRAELKKEKARKKEEKEREAELEREQRKIEKEAKRKAKEAELELEKAEKARKREEERKEKEIERELAKEEKQDFHETQKRLKQLVEDRAKQEEAEAYQKWKKWWEERGNCKILDEDAYLYYEGVHSDIPSTRSAGSLLSTYGHTSWFKFLVRWTKDPKIRVYKKIDSYPHDVKCPDNVFNIWVDLPYYKKNVAWEDVKVVRMINGVETEFIHTAETALEFVQNHFSVLVNHHPESLQYFLDSFACTLQYPSTKIPMNTFVSEEGAGKGTYLEFKKLLLGKDKVISVSDADVVFGKFNGVLQNAFLVVLNEVDARQLQQYDGRMKDYITDPTIQIQFKGKDPKTINSIHHFEHFTNEEDCPIQTSKKDRRKFIMRCSDEKIGDTLYFTELRVLLNHSPFGQVLHDFFMKRDVEEFKKSNGSKFPITEFQEELREAKVSPVREWIRHLVFNGDHEDDLITLTNVQCLSSYKLFCEVSNFKDAYNTIQLSLRISKLKINGVEKGKNDTNRFWTFQKEIVKAFLGV